MIILPSRHSGFTLVELIVLLIVAGVLAAAVLPRWHADTGFESRGFRDELMAGLRYAQKSAVAARRTVCATFASPPAKASFSISTAQGASDCSAGSTLVGPDGSALVVEAKQGVNFAAPLPADVIFDSAGRPGAAASISVSDLPSELAITIEAETGYVH